MRSISEIIRDLRQCIGMGCEDCSYRDAMLAEALPFCGNCMDALESEACQALEDMQARCARYAEEIMMLREQLKEARHE